LYYLYILKSKTSDKYYIGHTENIERRLFYHNSGYSKSTKYGVPWELVYLENYNNRSEAVQRENQLKSQKSEEYISRLIEKYQVDEHPDENREGHRFCRRHSP
jgi:putative endonuclease